MDEARLNALVQGLIASSAPSRELMEKLRAECSPPVRKPPGFHWAQPWLTAGENFRRMYSVDLGRQFRYSKDQLAQEITGI